MFGYVKKDKVKKAIEDELKIYVALMDGSANDVRQLARGIMDGEHYRRYVEDYIDEMQPLWIHKDHSIAQCAALNEACESYNHWRICCITLRDLFLQMTYEPVKL